jgi:predicted RNA binding protein YcfA (HicA-like mRNA interferase family)
VVQGYYTAVIRELKAVGYAYDQNSKGSHEIWRCPGREAAIVPRNLNSRHTANAILKTAGINRKLW